MCWQGASYEHGTSGGGCPWEQPPHGSGAAGDMGDPAQPLLRVEPQGGSAKFRPSHQVPIADAASPRTGLHSSTVWDALGPGPAARILRAAAWHTGSHLTAWQRDPCPELEHPARSSRAVGSRCLGAMSHSYLATGSSSGFGLSAALGPRRAACRDPSARQRCQRHGATGRRPQPGHACPPGTGGCRWRRFAPLAPHPPVAPDVPEELPLSRTPPAGRPAVAPGSSPAPVPRCPGPARAVPAAAVLQHRGQRHRAGGTAGGGRGTGSCTGGREAARPTGAG